MTSRKLSYVGFASMLALGVNGCASVQPPARMVEIRPAKTAEAPGSAAGNLYQAAVSAVDRRDYAQALDLLQAARDRAPQDARVLNAFGVVYDKLGRFDLSSRYYAQAQAADPGSAIVAENQAYSNVLQGKAPLPVLAAQEAEPPSAPAPARAASLAAATPAASAPATPVGAAPTHVALAQVPKLAAPPPAAVQAPLVIASAQTPPERRAPALVITPVPAVPPQTQKPPVASAVEHAAAAVPAVRVALAAPVSREPLPAAAAPLQQSPLAVGLLIAPSSPAPWPAATPLQLASIPAQPSLKIQPPSLQARAQLAALPVAPAAEAPVPATPVMKVSLPAPATKPLVIPQPQAEKRSPLPMTQVAARTNGPAMVVAPPAARPPARLTALPLLQSGAPAVLRRVNLPVFQVASSLTPQAYGPISRSPEDRAASAPAATHDAPPAQAAAAPSLAASRPLPVAAVVHARPSGKTAPAPRPVGPAAAPRQVAASVPVRRASLTRAVAAIVQPPAPRRSTGSGFIGRALVIIDASGNRRVADALRLQLARRGWSVPGARLPSLARRGQTTIRYAAAHATVARALANSLRIPVKLERCARPCQGVSLILGADSRAPTGSVRFTSGLRRLS